MLIIYSQEAITATISLDDDDRSTIQLMLTYLYTLDYDDQDASESESQDTEGHLADSSSNSVVVDNTTTLHCKRMNNVLVYALAEKYNIPALKELAATKFVRCEGPSDFAQYQELVNTIFESTPDTDTGLWNVVILDCANIRFIEKVLEKGLAPAIRDHGIFGLRMLRELVKKHNSKLENLNAELETKAQAAKVRENDLKVELDGSKAKLKNVRAELERKKRTASDRALELKDELNDLYYKVMGIYVPEKEDSSGAFERFRQALDLFQQKLLNLRDSVKLADQDGPITDNQIAKSLGCVIKSNINSHWGERGSRARP